MKQAILGPVRVRIFARPRNSRWLAIPCTLSIASIPALMGGTAYAQTWNTARQDAYTLEAGTNGRQFRINHYKLESSQPLDTSNLTIDAAKVQAASLPWFYDSAPNGRYALLANGLANVSDTSKQTSDDKSGTDKWAEQEREAQLKTSSQPKSAPVAPPSDVEVTKPAAEGPSFLSQIGSWIWNNWIGVLSIPLLGGIWAAVVRQRNARRVSLIYLGLPGSGKTALIERMAFPELPESHFDTDNRSKKKHHETHDPIPAGHLLITPVSYDAPGGKPEIQLDQVLSGTDHKGRNVLLVVLAPYAEGEGATAEEAFLQTQLGYIMSLPVAMIRSGKMRKPSAVFVFMNKFDQFRTDKMIVEDGKAFLGLFSKHVAELRAACSEQNIPFDTFYGSARAAINTITVLNQICKRVVSSGKA